MSENNVLSEIAGVYVVKSKKLSPFTDNRGQVIMCIISCEVSMSWQLWKVKLA